MKIVLPVHHFPPHYNAGAELYTFRLARWLRQHGHQSHVVTIESIKNGRSYTELQVIEDHYEGIPVSRLSFDIYKAPPDSAIAQVWEFNNPLLGAWFEEYFRREKPDLAHFQAGYLIGAAPLFAAAQAQIPVALTLHDYWFLCQRITLLKPSNEVCVHVPDHASGCAWCQALGSRAARTADKWTGGLAGKVVPQVAMRKVTQRLTNRHTVLAEALCIPRAVIAPSRFLASKFEKAVLPDRLLVSGYGLDLTPFQSAAQALDNGHGEHEQHDNVLRIGFIGQVGPHKGVHLIVEAFKALRPNQIHSRKIELHIYGNMEQFPAYGQQIHESVQGDDRITLHGRFDNKRVAEVLHSFDVSVVPSTWYENAPLAILESRAAGTPVITSRLGGMAELVQHELDGLHFTPNDASDLARVLQRLLDEPDLLPRLHKGTHLHVPRDIEDEMAQVMKIYESVLAT